MHSDSFFFGSRSHKSCQDYARSGTINNKCYAIIADGCSSSPDTDFGSRLITLSAVDTIKNEDIFQGNEVIKLADSFRHRELSQFCLDSTLISIHVNRSIWVNISGDGLVVRATKDGLYNSNKFDCNGAPNYLSYLLDENRMKKYKEEFGKIKIYHEDLNIETEIEAFSENNIITNNFELSIYKYAIAFSDGIFSFQNKETLELIDYKEVLKEILDFKSFTGEFISRKMKKFLTKTCQERNWINTDDISVAGIYLEEEK